MSGPRRQTGGSANPDEQPGLVGAELARALGVSETTVRRYLDALTDALVVRQVQPWLANIAKRQVRSPKVYVRDTGLLHRLLGMADRGDLLSHPKLGASHAFPWHPKSTRHRRTSSSPARPCPPVNPPAVDAP